VEALRITTFFETNIGTSEDKNNDDNRSTCPVQYAIFGHQVGAYLAYELVRELRLTSLVDVDHLFISDAIAPKVIHTIRPFPFPANKSKARLHVHKRRVTSNDEIQSSRPLLRSRPNTTVYLSIFLRYTLNPIPHLVFSYSPTIMRTGTR